MIEVALMIEAQNGLNWGRWQKLAQAAEDLGFAGLYRSDHYTNARPPDIDSLECWVSLAWLASHTRHVEFGPLVSPLSFRHPTMLARMASAVDDLSGGRLTLGLGAGWQEREHAHYGWQLLDVPGRMERFEDGLEIVTRLFNSDRPVDYAGRYYHVQEAVLLPRPARPGGPPILIGGNGEKRTLPLVARYAAEWNGNFLPPAEFARLNARLDELLAAQNRRPADVRRSLMTGCHFGRDEEAVKSKLAARGRTADEVRAMGMIFGTANQIVEQLGWFAEAGVQRIMLQWLDLEALDDLEAMAKFVLPQVK